MNKKNSKKKNDDISAEQYMKQASVLNWIVVMYVIVGYISAMYSVMSLKFLWIGIPLMMHTMSFSAYLLHDLMHGTLFPWLPTYHRALFANLLLHICGCPYADFDELRHMHLLHHSSKADTATFDYKCFLEKRPIVEKIVKCLEWVYLPAVEWISHTRVFINPLVKRNSKQFGMNVLILTLRIGMFLRCCAISPFLSFACYSIAWNGMVTLLRLGDCFQHTYDILLINDSHTVKTEKDTVYEQENTYSTIFCNYPFLNFLLHLNFGYHNAHHHRTSLAWHELPQAHRNFYSKVYQQKNILSMVTLLQRFHSRRIERISTTRRSVDIGFLDVSFLTDIQ